MRKLIYTLLFFFCFFTGGAFTYSQDAKDVFSDVTDEYEYLEELEYLLDIWIMNPRETDILDGSWYMQKWFFLWEALQLQCESCLPYEIHPRLVTQHAETKSFFDVVQKNEYYFCSEESKEEQYFLDKLPWDQCEDGIRQDWSIAFCSEDTVSRKEAVRALLMISWLYDSQDYLRDLTALNNGDLDIDIANDVEAFDDQSKVNPYFLYIRKALSYSLEEGDLEWNIKKYDFLSLKEERRIEGDMPITRNEFIKMAYMLSKSLPCSSQKADFSSLIDIYPAACDPDEFCGKDPLSTDARSYDLRANYAGICSDWIDEETNIVWRIYHTTSDTLEIIYGSYADNVDLSQAWERLIYLGIIDSCWGISYAKSTVFIWEEEWETSLSIEANPNNTQLWNAINFRALFTSDSDQPFIWSFWDANNGNGESFSHTYDEEGTYFVGLSQGNVSSYIHVNLYEADIDIATVIDIYDADCTSQRDCSKANLQEPAREYDFYANFAWVCEDGIEESNKKWTFSNTQAWVEETRTGEYIDNFDFSENGMRSITLEVIDVCGQTGSAVSYLNIGNDGDEASLWIEADAINVQPWTTINFTGLSSDPEADFSWNFWDGGTGSWANIAHTFNQVGTYTVELESGWNTATITINVYEDNSWNDRDGDGVEDSQDQCPDVPWVPENWGCPVLAWDSDGDGVDDGVDDCPTVPWPAENGGCPNDGDDNDSDSVCGWINGGCPNGYVCSIYEDGPWTGACLIDDVCSLSLHGGTAWNVTCNECPCNYSINFNAELKICDIVFPAITSPDGSQIYSKGNNYQILR